jgi:hypothetical protein
MSRSKQIVMGLLVALFGSIALSSAASGLTADEALNQGMAFIQG